jgi:prepilin-type N-terminal cleavage/methylation domain-containing protein
MSRPSPLSRSLRRAAVGHARHGFSLIEILVVIGLIAFLTAAIVAVIPRVANAAKVAATKATIKKVDEMLNDRINGFRRFIQKQDQQAGSGTPGYVLQAQSLSGQTILTPGTSLSAAKVIAVKALFKMYFAQAYTELDQTTQSTNPRGASHEAVTDSAECLYLIITKGPLFDTEPPSAADLKAIETADPDGDGIPEIVDAWGQPLRFYRWPTRLVRPSVTSPWTTPGPIDEILQPTGSGPPPLALFPPTPLTLAMVGAMPRPSLQPWKPATSGVNYSLGSQVVQPILSPTQPGFSLIYQCVTANGAQGNSPPTTWPTVVGQTVADSNVAWQALPDLLSIDPDDPFGTATSLITETPSSSSPLPPLTPNTWSVPLIVSCGTDGHLGLFEPYDTTNFGNLAQPMPPPSGVTDASPFWRDAMYDNITNHQQ